MITEAIAAAALFSTQAPPSTLTLSQYGPATFSDNMQTRICDDQLDPSCPTTLKHLRPVLGIGDPTSLANREGSNQTLWVDPHFPGVLNNTLGVNPLGLNPFTQNGQYLAIRAQPAPQYLQPWIFERTFYSGLIESKFLFTFTYGLVSVEANIDPCAPGTWPAIWTSTLSNWPSGGELDFPEGIGTGEWWFSEINAVATQHIRFVPPQNCVRGNHNFAVLKMPAYVAFYYDQALIGSMPASADMNVPHQLIIDMNMGGSWAIGASGPPANAPETAYVYSVHAWSVSP